MSLDPGAGGGLALLKFGDEERPSVQPLPNTPERIPAVICEAAHSIATPFAPPVLAIVEQVGGYVRNNPLPGSAMFTFGACYGAIIATLQGLKYSKSILLDYTTIPPGTWQRVLGMVGAGASRSEHKRMLRLLAKRLFPDVKGITNRTCDALLLLEAGRLMRLF